MRNLAKNIKRLIVALVTLILLGIIAIAFYITYLDANTSAAKKYLVERYGIDEKELKPKKYIKYVYEDIVNCDQEWFRTCTDDENLEFQYIFDYKGISIIVNEDKSAKLTDDYPEEPIKTDDTNN